MAEITTQMVKELREATSAGVLDCKKALAEAAGNFEEAVDILRRKGLASAAKKASRDTNDGLVGTYIHHDGKMAAMVELACETDFVARTDQFQQLARDLAMHVAAARPLYVSRDDVPAEMVEQEKVIYRDQMTDSGKPENVINNVIQGKLDKWFRDVCLLEQGFVREPDTSVEELIKDNVAALGENIRINRFARLAIGE